MDRNTCCRHAFTIPQTSYLLLFTVAVDCGKKAGGFKNYYFPDKGACLRAACFGPWHWVLVTSHPCMVAGGALSMLCTETACMLWHCEISLD